MLVWGETARVAVLMATACRADCCICCDRELGDDRPGLSFGEANRDKSAPAGNCAARVPPSCEGANDDVATPCESMPIGVACDNACVVAAPCGNGCVIATVPSGAVGNAEVEADDRRGVQLGLDGMTNDDGVRFNSVPK